VRRGVIRCVGAASVLLALAIAPPAHADAVPAAAMRETLRQEALARINRDRVAHGLRPVALDRLASAVADDYCRRQIEDGTTGHFTLDGQAPYMRYSFAGGNDAVIENTAAWSADYPFADEMLLGLVHRSHDAMVDEVPPNDGHRRAILDPHATHVGLGFAWLDGEFRLAQEFIRRYVAWDETPPRRIASNHVARLRGRPLPGWAVQAISVHYEHFPQRIRRATANGIESYSLPDARRDYHPRSEIASSKSPPRNGTPSDFTSLPDGSFSFAVPFERGAGIYTIVVWVAPAAGGRAVPASNISLEVSSR
jgi:uncharacterized protein YkwD